MAFTSRLSEHQAMRARHDADSRLRTLSIGLYPTAPGAMACSIH